MTREAVIIASLTHVPTPHINIKTERTEAVPNQDPLEPTPSASGSGSNNIPPVPSLPTLAMPDDSESGSDPDHAPPKDKKIKSESTTGVEAPISQESSSACSVEGEDFFDVLFVRGERNEPHSVEERVLAEISRFKAEPSMAVTSDPFKWWAGRSSSFPILHEVALSYLFIPGTSVASERVFSSAGDIINKKRCALHPDNADILIFLHKNYKNYC